MDLMRSIQELRGRRVGVGLATLVVVASVSTVVAHGEDRLTSPVGTWGIEVQIRNCQSEAAIGLPFLSLITLHSGGTLGETSGAEAAFAVGQRSPGHGVWEKISRHVYDARLISLVLFETAPNLPGSPGFNPALPVGPGFFKGWDTVTQTLRFADSDHFTSKGTSAFFKEDGTLYREGCSTAIGQRVF
jgi:hypothetical protein